MEEEDRIVVLPGNNVMFESVGQRGTLERYFEDDGKWGIRMDNGENALISKKNLRRARR